MELYTYLNYIRGILFYRGDALLHNGSSQLYKYARSYHFLPDYMIKLIDILIVRKPTTNILNSHKTPIQT